MHLGPVSPNSAAPVTTERASTVRWRILALLMAMTFMCHFNRIAMPVAGTMRIMEEYKISEPVMGAVYSAYLIVYTICMTPGGWFIDRFGVKLALLIMAAGAGVCSILTGMSGFISATWLLLAVLFVVRAINGLVAAPTHPGAARGVASWTPERLMSVTNGAVVAAAILGIACTYYVFGEMLKRFGWPTAFVITGTATVALALIWTLYYTNSPAEHRGVNSAELHYIATHPPHEAPTRVEEPLSWTDMLRNRSLILVTICYGAIGYFQFMFFYWVQYYFRDVIELEDETSRLYSTIATVSMAIGMFLGGWIADWLGLNFGRRLGRTSVAMFGLMAGTLFLVLGLTATVPLWIVTWLSWSMFCVGLSEGPGWATAIELGGTQGGTSAGIFNTGGNIGGFLAPWVVPLIADYTNWTFSAMIAGALCFIGAILWIWVRPDERVTKAAPAGSSA